MSRDPVGSSGSRYGWLAPISNAAPSGPTLRTSARSIRSRNIHRTTIIREDCSHAGNITGSCVSAPRNNPHERADTTRNASATAHSSPRPYKNSSSYGISEAVTILNANTPMHDKTANSDSVFNRLGGVASSVRAVPRGDGIPMGTFMGRVVIYKSSWINRELS